MIIVFPDLLSIQYVFYEDTTGFTQGIYVIGDYGYVADAGSGLEVINISDPTNLGTCVNK